MWAGWAGVGAHRSCLLLFYCFCGPPTPPTNSAFSSLNCISFAFHRLASCVCVAQSERSARTDPAPSAPPKMPICGHCAELKPAASAGSCLHLSQGMCNRDTETDMPARGRRERIYVLVC